jgi:ABC-type phosphate transport system ATPase subunit
MRPSSCRSELVEMGPAGQIFTKPRDQRAGRYMTSRFG